MFNILHYSLIQFDIFSGKSEHIDNTRQQRTFRAGRLHMSYKKSAPENCGKFTGKHMCWSLLINKVAGVPQLS